MNGTYRKKSLKKNKKKYKTKKRVAISRKVVHRGGDLKSIWQNERDKMLTKLGRQTQEKTEFKQLLREIERLRIFESEECDVFLRSLPNPNHIDKESILDFLKKKFNSSPNGQAIIGVLIKLGLLYLKNESTWDYQSKVDTVENGKNMKYNCLMFTGVMIGEKMKKEKESVLEKLKIIKKQINELLVKTRQEKTAIMWKLSQVYFNKDSPFQEENSKLLTLLENLEYRNRCIDAVILEITKSDYVDVDDLNRKFNCVGDAFGKQLSQLLKDGDAKVDSDGRTVVRNGEDIGRLENKWTTGPLSNEEELQQNKIQLSKNPTSSTSKQLMARIENLEKMKGMHNEELKNFLDRRLA
jgi:hypothetical protein